MLKYLLILLIPTLSQASEHLSRKRRCYAPIMHTRRLSFSDQVSYVELHSAINVAIAKRDAQCIADLIKNRTVEEGALDKGLDELYEKLEAYHQAREFKGYTREYHGFVYYQAIKFIEQHKERQ